MENKILTGSQIIISGEKTETASGKEISRRFEGSLRNDGNIYYPEISPNYLGQRCADSAYSFQGEPGIRSGMQIFICRNRRADAVLFHAFLQEYDQTGIY